MTIIFIFSDHGCHAVPPAAPRLAAGRAAPSAPWRCAALRSGAGSSGRAAGGGRLDVVAGFYPFAFLAERIGGDHVVVRNLTRPGAEPHDLELTPSQVGAVSKADLAIYEKGLQPAVDAAVAQNKPKAALDAATVVHLENHGDLGEGDAHSADPHIWLDPVDFAKVADAVSAKLQRIDPAHAADYQANQAALDGQLKPWTPTTGPGWRTARARTSSPATPPSATSPSATAWSRSRSPGCRRTTSPARPTSRRSST